MGSGELVAGGADGTLVGLIVGSRVGLTGGAVAERATMRAGGG